jgi:hypothetical protein
MYQRSWMMLLFLVIICLAVNIACGAIAVIALEHVVVGELYLLTWRTRLIGQTLEELILSGAYICYYKFEKDAQLLTSMVWMLNTTWEVLVLCLSVCVAVKHFRDLRRLGPSTGSITGDCFRVLIQSHVLYFARWACNVNVVVFPAQDPYVLALLVSLVSSLVFSLQGSWCADLSVKSACNHCSPSSVEVTVYGSSDN